MPERPHIQEEWWRPDQVELANDGSRIWEKRAFTIQPGYSIPCQGGRLLTRLPPGDKIPDGATLEPGAWDREHCALCFKKIMEQGGDFQEGYTGGKDWVCPQCYGKYLAPS